MNKITIFDERLQLRAFGAITNLTMKESRSLNPIKIIRQLEDFILTSKRTAYGSYRFGITEKDWFIVMPEYINTFVVDQYCGSMRPYFNPGEFMGFKILPGYENKFIFFHKDYQLYEEKELFYEEEIILL